MTIIEIIAWSAVGLGALMWVVIAVRKFSLLASIDLTRVPSAVDRQVKLDLVEQRLRRRFHESSLRVFGILGPLVNIVRQVTVGGYGWLVKIEQRYRDRIQYHEQSEQGLASQKNVVMELLSQADQLYSEEKYTEAEKKYIEVIRLSPKTVEAYRGLGRVYLFQKNYRHARASLVHAAKLAPDDADVQCTLAEIYAELDKMNRALKAIEQAVELQPNNPKYLDLAVELALNAHDVYFAEKMLGRLRTANPENQKIEEYENQIFQMKTKKM